MKHIIPNHKQEAIDKLYRNRSILVIELYDLATHCLKYSDIKSRYFTFNRLYFENDYNDKLKSLCIVIDKIKETESEYNITYTPISNNVLLEFSGFKFFFNRL